MAKSHVLIPLVIHTDSVEIELEDSESGFINFYNKECEFSVDFIISSDRQTLSWKWVMIGGGDMIDVSEGRDEVVFFKPILEWVSENYKKQIIEKLNDEYPESDDASDRENDEHMSNLRYNHGHGH